LAWRAYRREELATRENSFNGHAKGSWINTYVLDNVDLLAVEISRIDDRQESESWAARII
jgi:hypothetical protein